MLSNKLPISIAKKLLALSRGETLPQSNFKGKWLNLLQQEEVVRLIRSGRTRAKVSISSLQALEGFLQNHYSIENLQAYVEALQSESLSGQEAQEVAGDTKLRKNRTHMGFLVNSVEPIEAQLNGRSFTIAPAEGSFMFIHDFESFQIPKHVTVVGIENPENFRQVVKQVHLFPERSLFVSRYPFSSDLKRWLESIPNPYLHFGDIDLAGIAIYEREFKPEIGSRASFYIPSKIEDLLNKNGSRKLYNQQLQKYRNLESSHPKLKRLIEIIHRTKKGLEQEALMK